MFSGVFPEIQQKHPAILKVAESCVGHLTAVEEPNGEHHRKRLMLR